MRIPKYYKFTPETGRKLKEIQAAMPVKTSETYILELAVSELHKKKVKK